jgi:hypothetical protein
MKHAFTMASSSTISSMNTRTTSSQAQFVAQTFLSAVPQAFLPALRAASQGIVGGLKPAAIALTIIASLLLSPAPVQAQTGIGDVVYTVGTTARDKFGRDWAFILWQATDPASLSNRVFAVYSKAGDATNNVPYARLSIVSLQTDARVIEPLLERAANLGDDTNKLRQDLTQLFSSLVPSSTISLGDQLSLVIRGSLSDPQYYQNLMLLARNHAGINLALGYADAQPIAPGRTTFEVRAFDLATSQDLAVVGRVTVEAGNPTVLPPPGPPILVPEKTAMGDLNLKFRWGTPDNLRRLGLMQFGYNLYRISNPYAQSKGWNITNLPTVQMLTNLVTTNPAVAKRVNKVPITPSKLMSLTQATNLSPLTGDTNTAFIMDDDGRGKTNYINYGFTNGAQFLYVVTARDVLGRDGLLSTGLLATLCDRMPPYPPTQVHVLNDYKFNLGTLTSNQALRVVWKQNKQTNETVSSYYVYRWTNLTEMNNLSGDPSLNLIAIVPAVPGTGTNSYLDNGPTSPTAKNAYGETFWYTVRAADNGACGANLSGFAGPAYGVLRDRIGPPAGTGHLEINCLRPLVSFYKTYTQALRDPDTNNYDYYLTCTRVDSRIEWAEFYGLGVYRADLAGAAGISVVSNYYGRLYFYSGSQVSAWWTPPRNPFTNAQPYASAFAVYCRAGFANGKVSDYATTAVNPPSSKEFTGADFLASAQSLRITAGDQQYSDCIEHDPSGSAGGDLGTNNIGIIFPGTPGSAEYRVYRRVDSGPLSLLCQGPITNISQTNECFEAAMPANGGTICFFLQLLDNNGNPSPITPLGCVDVAPNSPIPTPMLSKIVSTGDSGSPMMSLNWFCPPYGVERFEVRVAALPTAPPLNLSSVLVNTGAPAINLSFTNHGTNYTLPFSSYITPKVGPGFGNNGALFQVPCAVQSGKTYFVKVRALSKNGTPGDYSGLESFTWTATNPPSPQVPWPARPLPPTNANFGAFVFYLSPTNANTALQTGGFDGNGMFIGLGSVGVRGIVSIKEPFTIRGIFDPNTVLGTNFLGHSVLPCALYRYQVANTNFPTVSGDTIQVSPLMETVSYRLAPTGNGTNTALVDPFVAGTYSLAGDTYYLWLWLKDTQPIISGARYQYVLVHFGANHEIDQLVPSNPVDVP